MRPSISKPPAQPPGFTLIELMVSMGIFTLVLLLTLQISSASLAFVKSSENRLATQRESSVAGRQLQLDFNQRVDRPDSPVRLEKKAGNDSLGLLTLRSGYIDRTTTPDRAASIVNYRVETDASDDSGNGLHRSSSGIGYGDLGERPALSTGTLDLVSIPDDGPDEASDQQFQLIAPGVIRLELSFIVNDDVQPIRMDPPADQSLIEAVIATVCILPSDQRRVLREGDLARISSAFGDSSDGELPTSDWIRISRELSTTLPSVPNVALKQLRVRQIIIPLNQNL